MKKKLLVSLLVAGFVLVSLLQFGKVHAVRADGPEQSFTFMTLPNKVGGGERMILNGHATFNSSEVEGGGTFTRFQLTGSTPFPVTDSGTWKAKGLISFTSPGTFGAHEAGIIILAADLVSDSGTITPATVKVVCNIGAGNLFTGQPGGVTLTITGGDTFVAVAPSDGLTIFSTRNEQ